MAKIVLISGSLPTLSAELRNSCEDVEVFTTEEFCISPAVY